MSHVTKFIEADNVEQFYEFVVDDSGARWEGGAGAVLPPVVPSCIPILMRNLMNKNRCIEEAASSIGLHFHSGGYSAPDYHAYHLPMTTSFDICAPEPSVDSTDEKEAIDKIKQFIINRRKALTEVKPSAHAQPTTHAQCEDAQPTTQCADAQPRSDWAEEVEDELRNENAHAQSSKTDEEDSPSRRTPSGCNDSDDNKVCSTEEAARESRLVTHKRNTGGFRMAKSAILDAIRGNKSPPAAIKTSSESSQASESSATEDTSVESRSLYERISPIGSVPQVPVEKYWDEESFTEPQTPSVVTRTQETPAEIQSAAGCSSNTFTEEYAKPLYRHHQLLGDSQFVRFSRQILDYRVFRNSISYCVSGQNIEGLYRKLVNKEFKLHDRVILMIGTNDLRNNASLIRMKESYTKLLDLLKQSVDKIVVVTIPPIQSMIDSVRHWRTFEGFNKFLLEQHNGKQVFVVDFGQHLVGYGGSRGCREYYEEVYASNPDRKDLVHLNKKGFVLLKFLLDVHYFHSDC